MKCCPLCGTPLIEKNKNLICPNHGIIETLEESKEKEPDYIG